jgi:spore maturation protein CgeB
MPEKKRINFFGSSLVSAYWNGAATYYRGIIKALNALGFEITFFEPDVYDRQNHRDLDELAYAKSVVYPAKCTEDIIRVLSTAANTDIVIKASGVGVFDRLLEEEILKMKTKDNIVIFWDVDAPATLERMQENSDDYFRKIVREYDLILTYGGGEPVVEKYKSFGAKKCIPIYNALDPDTHYPVDRNTNFSADLAFLGNRMPDRESRVFEFFFKPAQMLPTKKFLLGGSGWDQNIPALPNLSYVGHVYTSLHNAFNCSPLAVLNISRDSMAKYGFSPATRLFEAAGAASCIITDKWQGNHGTRGCHRDGSPSQPPCPVLADRPPAALYS